MNEPILTGSLESDSFLDRLVFHRHGWAASSGVSTGGGVFLYEFLWGTPAVDSALAVGAMAWLATFGLGVLLKRYRDASGKGMRDDDRDAA